AMTRVTLVIAAAVVSLVLVGVAPAGAAQPKLGPCGAKPDSHGRWAIVFVTEKTKLDAEKALKLVRSRGYSRAFIEVESCTAYEVEWNNFRSSAAAQTALNAVKKAGFKSVKREDS